MPVMVSAGFECVLKSCETKEEIGCYFKVMLLDGSHDYIDPCYALPETRFTADIVFTTSPILNDHRDYLRSGSGVMLPLLKAFLATTTASYLPIPDVRSELRLYSGRFLFIVIF
jgi:hypothetical protein